MVVGLVERFRVDVGRGRGTVAESGSILIRVWSPAAPGLASTPFFSGRMKGSSSAFTELFLEDEEPAGFAPGWLCEDLAH